MLPIQIVPLFPGLILQACPPTLLLHILVASTIVLCVCRLNEVFELYQSSLPYISYVCIYDNQDMLSVYLDVCNHLKFMML